MLNVWVISLLSLASCVARCDPPGRMTVAYFFCFGPEVLFLAALSGATTASVLARTTSSGDFGISVLLTSTCMALALDLADLFLRAKLADPDLRLLTRKNATARTSRTAASEQLMITTFPVEIVPSAGM